MVIRVNISELESKAKYAESLSIQLKIKEDEINSIYYSLDPKVKSRNGIGQSMISLQKRIEEAQKKMYNISKFLYSAAENYRNAEEQIVSNSKRFEDSHRLYDEQYSDYNYIKNLNIFEGANIEDINSVNNVEMDSKVIDYLKKSGNQLILGNYTEDVTLLGTLMQVGTGLLGVDLPMDLRDILYDFTNWKWSWEHAGKAGMDLLALFPIIGGLKYADEASSLAKAAFKNTDEASALMKGALKNTDEASTLIKGSLKSSDEISDIAKGVDETVEFTTKRVIDPNAKEIISKRVSGLDLNEYQVTNKQLSSKKMLEIRSKIDNRTATKAEYEAYEWNKRFSARRREGVKQFWNQERERIINGESITRNWTTEQIQDILNGRTPKYDGKPIQGHHSYSVSKYPHLADKGEIIYPVTPNEHLKGWHGGNYKNSNPGEPIIDINDF